MMDADAAPPTPPPEVVAHEEHPAATDSAVAAPEEAATAEVDNKRKLEEASADADAEANGTGEDAKRPRVDGEPNAVTGAGVEQQNDGSSVNVAEPTAAQVKVASTDGAADGDNGTTAPAPAPTPAPESVSDEKPLEAAAEAPRQEGDAATAAQDISRMIQVPNNKLHVLIGKLGETIRNLQNSSGAKILINKHVHADSDALTRSVELIGTLGSVDRAEELIKAMFVSPPIHVDWRGL